MSNKKKEIADATEIDREISDDEGRETSRRRLVRCGDEAVAMTVSQFFGLVQES